MTRTRGPAIAGFATIAAVVLGAGLWAWKPWAGSPPRVPTCSELVAVLPAASWSLSRPDAGRGEDQSTASCELAFASADKRFAGTLRAFISGESDTDLLRRRAAEEPCDGTPEPGGIPNGYLAFRACSAVAGDFAHATVIAAGGNRWLRMIVSTGIRDDNRDAVLPFSRDLVRKATAQGLTR